MNKIIKNVLTKIENNGYEAYLIGGYVRDLLVGKSSYDIDICTNATPRELINIFPNGSTKNLGGIDFKIKEYHFEITTYREEIKYKNRKPIEYHYVNSLIEDLKRRDFTINTICINYFTYNQYIYKVFIIIFSKLIFYISNILSNTFYFIFW